MVQMTNDVQSVFHTSFEDVEKTDLEMALGWSNLAKGQPLPDTPEVRAMILELMIGMYGEALRELEKH